ncbi:hypothetical protein APHAL10511_004994 [Amanita phalloides]|nr:hypothetical protein APHAL10511_004994 [Amanita phalloides]
MDQQLQHALALLEEASAWDWHMTQCIQDSGKQGGKHKTHLLTYLIMESFQLGGTVLNQFWDQLGNCHQRLRGNIEIVKGVSFTSQTISLAIILEGLNREEIDFMPVLNMAGEYFTHLGIAILNPGGPKSGAGTAFSVSEVIDKGTDELLRLFAAEESFGKRKQEYLKALLFKRDHSLCPVSALPFYPEDPDGYRPIMAHVIPTSIHGKVHISDVLNYLLPHASYSARYSEMYCYQWYESSERCSLESGGMTIWIGHWAIEARDEAGRVKYIYRRVPFSSVPGPKPVQLKDGDEIIFGAGPDGTQLGGGPLPRLCNLHLAVARVLKMSGAADIILEWKDKADDGGVPHLFIASEHYCNILNAQLLLSGQAVL